MLSFSCAVLFVCDLDDAPNDCLLVPSLGLDALFCEDLSLLELGFFVLVTGAFRALRAGLPSSLVTLARSLSYFCA